MPGGRIFFQRTRGSFPEEKQLVRGGFVVDLGLRRSYAEGFDLTSSSA